MDNIRQAIDKCDFKFNGCIISKEKVIKEFWNYLCDSAINEKAKTGFIFHTGSQVFDAVLIIFASFLAIQSNEVTSEEVVRSLEIGSQVEYKGKVYNFFGVEQQSIGKDYKEYARITNGKRDTIYVPLQMWNEIKPYNGNAKTRTRVSNKTFKLGDILNIAESNIIMSSSVVLVEKKKEYEDIFDHCEIVYNGKTEKLSNLLTASYVTDDNEIQHSGNAAQNEPVLKFTNSVNVAIKQVRSRETNRVCGVFTIGNTVISRNSTEYDALLHDRHVKLFFASDVIGSTVIYDTFHDVDDFTSFSCTKENLLHWTSERSMDNQETRTIYTQADRIKEHEESVVSAGELAYFDETYELLKDIKRDAIEVDTVLEFVRKSFSLLKFLKYSVFAMNEYEEWLEINSHQRALLPSNRILDLQECAEKVPSYAKIRCLQVIENILCIYNSMVSENRKEKLIIDITNCDNGDTAIVVEKSLYASILRKKIGKNIDIIQVNNLKNKDYNRVIFSGDFSEKINQFECYKGRKIVSVLYDSERKYYEYKERYFEKKRNKFLNIKSKDSKNPGSGEFFDFEAELNDYLKKASFDTSKYAGTGKNGGEAEAKTFVSFSNGSHAFFTENYHAYVLNETAGEIEEKLGKELCPGNQILFVRSTDDTRDIVDSILNKLIAEKKISDEMIKTYKKSKTWKDILKDYKYIYRASDKDVINALKEKGATVSDVTIKNWLDGDNRIVGPENVENIKYIGALMNNKELQENYKSYEDIFKKVRALRLKIMGQIGKALIAIASGEEVVGEIAEYEERVKQLIELYEVEQIYNISERVSLSQTNKPIL